MLLLCRWVSGAWSGCLCGRKKLREVTCQKPTNEKPSSVVEDSVCSNSGLDKPVSVKECTADCLTNWTIGQWSQVHTTSFTSLLASHLSEL